MIIRSVTFAPAHTLFPIERSEVTCLNNSNHVYTSFTQMHNTLQEGAGQQVNSLNTCRVTVVSEWTSQ